MTRRPSDLHEQFLMWRFDDAAVMNAALPYRETRPAKILFDDLGKGHTRTGGLVNPFEHDISLVPRKLLVEPSSQPSEKHDHGYEPENCKGHPPPTVGERKDYGYADDEHQSAKVNAIPVDKKSI